jgi:hypothetical protein
MTKTKAIQIAKNRIKSNTKYINELENYDKENPDKSEDQIGARIYKLVIKIITSENLLLDQIIAELKSN